MKLLPIFFAALILAGCNILPKPAAVHDFGITPSAQNKEETAISQRVITVEAPKWLYDNRIRYRLLYASPTQVSSYSLDRWLAPPPDLFEQLLTSSLDNADPITVRLLEFEQQFISPAQAEVVMRFKVTAAKNGRRGERSEEFRLRESCAAPNAKGAVAAFSTLTRKAAQTVSQWLKN